MPSPMLNPMHPPLAKQLIALSIRTFGDVPLGWRYPGVLFGALAVVAIYLCGLALFAAQGSRDRRGVARLLQPDAVRAVADRDAGYFRARVRPVRRSRPSCTASGNSGRICWFALAGLGFGLSIACKWSGLFPLAICIVIVAVIRLMQGWRTQFADGNADDWYRPDLWPDFRLLISPLCFVLIPAVDLSRDLRSALWIVAARPPGSATPDLRR